MTAEELTKTHSDYDSFIVEWQFYVRSYLGGKFYRDGDYLLKHPFESTANYERRKSIAYYYNYCAPIIDIYSSYLYKNSPQRSYGKLSDEAVPPRQPKTLFDAFWWDCDLEGTSLDQFIRDAVRYAGIYGRVSIIVDKPSITVSTKAEAMALGIRPYLTIVTPENLLDWRYVRLATGHPVLDMVKIKEGEGEYRIWTRNKWELWVISDDGKEASLKDAGWHGLDEIPIVNLYNKKSGIRMIGTSDLQDIADINKNIYYFCSDAKEIIENSAFPMLALPYEKSAGGNSEKQVGPKNILEFDPDQPNSKPEWLEPPHSSLIEIREWIDQDIREIYRVARMGGVRATEDMGQPQSGVAIELLYRHLHAALSEKATNAEQAELDIFRLYSKWEGEEFTGNVKYPTEFAVKDLTTALQNAVLAGKTRINSLTFEKERQKKIVIASLPEMEEATRETIFEEIDELKEISTPPQEDPNLKADNMGEGA